MIGLMKMKGLTALFSEQPKNKSYVTRGEKEDGHILIVGGAGSGKTTCIAIPTLRAWREPVFVIDIKGELYDHSYEHRERRGRNIKVFNPQGEYSYGYDPYFYLRKSLNPAQEARAIAQALIPLPPNAKEPFWVDGAQNILTGTILHFYRHHSFIDTLKIIQSTGAQKLIELLAQSDTEEALLCVGSFVDMDIKVLSGFYGELSRCIIPLVTDREIVSALSREDVISPLDLESGADVYINIPEHLLRQWDKLLSLMINQFLNYFERRKLNEQDPVLFMLDEFPRLGKIPAIMDGLATLRGRKITISLIIQSLAQLDLIYGIEGRRVLVDNCAYKAILSAFDAESQEYFSKLVDTYDKIRISKSTTKSPFLAFPSSKGAHETTEEKRIIKPSEFATLRDIVMLTPDGYFRVDKKPYYES